MRSSLWRRLGQRLYLVRADDTTGQYGLFANGKLEREIEDLQSRVAALERRLGKTETD